MNTRVLSLERWKATHDRLVEDRIREQMLEIERLRKANADLLEIVKNKSTAAATLPISVSPASRRMKDVVAEQTAQAYVEAQEKRLSLSAVPKEAS